MKIVLVLILLLVLIRPNSYSTGPNLNQYDSNFYNTALIWHGQMPVDDFAVLLKAEALQESSMRPFVTRDETGYLTGRYAAQVTVTARRMKAYAKEHYGVEQSLYTWRTDLSKSYGLIQIMLQRAVELGWRGPSAYDPCCGLINVDTGLYYGAELMHKNLVRYNYNVSKAISAYNAGSATRRNSEYVANVAKNIERFLQRPLNGLGEW